MNHLETLIVEQNESLIGLSMNDSLFVSMQVKDISRWMPIMLNPRLRSKKEMFIHFPTFRYLDDIYFDFKKRKMFDKFLVDWMENRYTGQIYTNYIFELRRKDLDLLENSGFLEWLYYTLLIFKNTRSNYCLIVNKECVSAHEQPIECKIARDFSDPRLNLCLDFDLLKCDAKVVIPEDIGCYTLLLRTNDEDEAHAIIKKFNAANAIYCDFINEEQEIK